MRKRYKVLIVIIIIPIMLLLIKAGFSHIKDSFSRGLSNPIVFESQSPYQMGKALFVSEGMQDRGISLYIHDYRSEHKFVYVGTLYWPCTRAIEACWSKDGSILACKNQLEEDVYFSYIYDFKNNDMFYPPSTSWSRSDYKSVKEEWCKHSEKMEALLGARGGKSVVLDLKNVYGNGYPASLEEWRRMKNIYKKIKAKDYSGMK
jgi:hypothetical protein